MNINRIYGLLLSLLLLTPSHATSNFLVRCRMRIEQMQRKILLFSVELYRLTTCVLAFTIAYANLTPSRINKQ